MTKKLSYDYVKSYIEDRGCKLLSINYKDQVEKLEIIFSCGHTEFRGFNKFKYGKNICSRCAGVKKYTFQEVKDSIEKNGYLLPEQKYISCKLNLFVLDNEGYSYSVSYDKFLNNVINRGTRLSRFDKANPYTIENIKTLLKKANSKLSLDDFQEWRGNNTKMFYTDVDGYKYSSKFSVVLKYANENLLPSKFDISNDYTIHNIETWIKINKKPYFLISGQKYLGKDAKLKFKCLKCPTEEKPFETNFSPLLSRDGGCYYCNSTYVGNCNNLEYKYPDIAKEWDYNKNNPITPNSVASHTNKKFYWICEDCGNSYLSSVGKRTGNEPRGCPICNESNLEKRIRKFLEKNNIIFDPQKRFDDCKNLLPLPFDFYFSDYNYVCEAQGIQHFFPVEHFGGESGFNKRLINDQIKRDYCLTNNIKLIEISYKDYKNIEKILTKELNLESNLESKPNSNANLNPIQSLTLSRKEA